MPALVHPAASRDPGEGHSMAEPVDDVLDPRVRQHVQGDRVGYDVAQVAAARAELVHRAVGR
jgi:hypothetical protein